MVCGERGVSLILKLLFATNCHRTSSTQFWDTDLNLVGRYDKYHIFCLTRVPQSDQPAVLTEARGSQSRAVVERSDEEAKIYRVRSLFEECNGWSSESGFVEQRGVTQSPPPLHKSSGNLEAKVPTLGLLQRNSFKFLRRQKTKKVPLVRVVLLRNCILRGTFLRFFPA